MAFVANIDLLWVGLAVAGAGMLGVSIYFSDTKSATARAFLLFALLSIFWSIANFASVRAGGSEAVLWLIRAVLFFAIWHAFSFCVLAWQFPERTPVFSRPVFIGLVSWTGMISIIVLTPVVYEAVTALSPAVETRTGPGVILFGLTVVAFVTSGIAILVRKFLRAEGYARRQLSFVIVGMAITFFFLVAFDFLFPAFLNIATLVPYGGLFLLPFIVGTAYAILRYRLFNVRVALFGLLIFLLATATFFDVLLSNSVEQVLYRVFELVLVLVAGVWLIRSMVHEFELEEELRAINARQEGLIHFIGHEVKGFLTKAQGALSMLVEGDFGALPQEALGVATQALHETQDGVTSVSEILKAANLKRGTVEFHKEPFDLKVLAAESVEKARSAAKAKGLALSFSAEDGGFTFVGDEGEIGSHVLRNLIDNAINYTPSGSIDVSLKKAGDRYLFVVKDTGVGISDEDRAHLFTEGGHGKDSQRVNVHSTGYGLYIAKQVAEAQGGTIRAESDGPGKGSAFTVEFPAS